MDNVSTSVSSNGFVDIAGYSPERIYDLQLYVENQGDKFHPLSDRLAAILENAEQAAHAPEELLRRLLTEITTYEAAPADPYHGYHIAQLRDRLSEEEDD
jgi:hypothetical protein